MAPKTRNHYLIGDPIDKISGPEMLTLRKMLQRFIFYHFTDGLTIQESLKS